MSESEDYVELGKQVEVVLSRLSDNGHVDCSFNIMMKWWDTITTVRNHIRQRTGVPHELIDILYSGKKMSGKEALYQLKARHNVIHLAFYVHSATDNQSGTIQIITRSQLDRDFVESLAEVRIAFAAGIKPELSLYGTGGTYFLNNTYKWNLLVFKPEDEEPFAENNPRDLQGKMGQYGFRKGIRSGEGWKREVAAYLLDRDHLFSVPTTVQSILFHPYFENRNPNRHVKIGSLQRFVEDADLCSDWSPSMYSTFEVQKIAFLDMYIMNTDRNDANILVKRQRNVMKLIPIDHGYALPDCFEINELSWCWLDWKQIQQPWDETLVKYAQNMDILADVRLLNECLGIRKICLIILRINGLLLKKAIQRGLTPAETASFFIRKDLNQEQPCTLEKIVQECIERVKVYYAIREEVHDNEMMMMNHSSSMHFATEKQETLVRNYSTQSMSSITYSEEPFRFSPNVEKNLIHNQKYRHLFFTVYEEMISFWISSVLNLRAFDSGICL